MENKGDFRMSNVLRKYYQGITQQLRSEVDFINSLLEHPGVKGAGNESALRDLITKFIPKRYGVGTGVIIDRHGYASRQCDIVIYDTFLYPSLLALTSVHLFPVDIVYATIEVKTTLTSTTAKEALENIASVRRLDFLKMDFGDQWMAGDTQIFGIRKTTPPLGFVFAYNSDAQQDDTFKGWFSPQERDNIWLYPSLVGCLDIGLVGFKNNTGGTGAISVHPESGMMPECMTFPVIKRKDHGASSEIESAEDIVVLNIEGPVAGKQLVSVEGIMCPIKKIGANYMAIDQCRVVLNFLLLMTDLLSLKKIHPSISLMESYMKGLDIFHFTC